MMNTNNTYNEMESISKDMFEFAQNDAKIHDAKFDTKARGYFADAMIRFKKSSAAVAGAWIIFALFLFSIISPIISPYKITDQDKFYVNYPPFIKAVSDMNIGIFNGGVAIDSQNDLSMAYWRGIAEETGYNPVIKVLGTTETTTTKRGQEVKSIAYKIRINKYYSQGMAYRVFSYEEFEDIMKWQDENGVQVIYPYVEPKDICDISDRPSIWYKVKDNKGTPAYDADGNFVPAYSTKSSIEGVPYTSIRVPGDDGSYIYSAKKSGAVQCRICYYNYYQYLNGHEPMYIFGTNSMGMDLFLAIGVGSRFSIIFAILVSVINLSIGAVYGAIQGYYGGYIDLVLDRISDLLSGVPFTVVAVLFQLHLAQKVGIVPAFLFAFVLTGWIGMAALTRKQFYRFKSQEFVLAARTLGASDWRLMFKHVFPNSLGTIVTSCALVIPSVIGTETSFTYLGLVNIQDFAGTSIGTLMSQGQTSMTSSPHAMFFPALYFALLMIAFNLFGNGLRDAFNPSMRGVED